MTKLDWVIIVVWMMTSIVHAQTLRVDTIVLSVYNTSQRFQLYPMPFGAQTPAAPFTAEMVASVDTVNVLRERRDSAGRFTPAWVTERVCGKISADLTGKVALLQLNPACNVSTQVLSAQEAGAARVVMIHTTNSRDSVQLPTNAPSVEGQHITIPCYTVRQGIGVKIRAMLPSQVGVAFLAPNDPTRSDVQNRVTMPSSSVVVATPVEKQAAAESSTGAIETGRIGWQLAPNPATDELTIRYQFAEKAATHFEIFDAIGQLVQDSEMPPAASGTFSVNVQSWRSGTYHLRLQHGTFLEVNRFTVIH